MGSGTASAGTEQIARNSGGESFPVSSPNALEMVMERLRQAYALFFNAEEQVRSINVFLSAKASSRHYGATLNFRRADAAGDVEIDPDVSWNPTEFPQSPNSTSDETDEDVKPRPGDSQPKTAKRRPGVNEPASAPSTAPVVTKSGEEDEKKGGFRRLKPGEKP